MKLLRITLAAALVTSALLAAPAPKQHKIGKAAARKIALAKEPGAVKSAELEREKGKLIYSFDIQAKDAIHEVNVDAYSGAVLEDSVEDTAKEAQEKKQGKKEIKEKN